MHAWWIACALAAVVAPVSAKAEAVVQLEVMEQGVAPEEVERRRLEEQISKELGTAPAPEGGAPAPTASPPPAGPNPYARLLALPDLSVVGSFSAAWEALDHRPALRLDEVELGLKSVVDPYARAEIFIAFGPEEVSVEEAFLTTLALPSGLQLRAGRIFAPWGRLNGQHPHTWEFADLPIAQARLLAEEALGGPGLDLSWLAPLPWFAELHVALQSTAPFEGDEDRLTGIVRLAQYFPAWSDTTLGVGLSAGRRDDGGGEVRDLGGADLLLRWRSPSSRASLSAQAELYGVRVGGGGADWGGYAQLVHRLGARLSAGVRYDQAPGEAGEERRVTALGTWFLSEFQRLRLQVTRAVREGAGDGWEALLQAEFGIGPHGAHPF